MKYKRVLLWLLPIVAGIVLAGCGGSGEAVVVEVTAVVTRIVATEGEPYVEIVTVTGQPMATSSPATTREPTIPDGAGIGGGPPQSMAMALAEIDQRLQNTMRGSIAHNAPEAMNVGDESEIQLLISPSLAPEALATAVTGAGPVISDTLDITPWMRTELVSPNPDAFFINPVHGDPEQPLSNVEPTEWKWSIFAREPGTHRLLLTAYRLVEINGRDHWRKVEEYQNELLVNVTWSERMAGLWSRMTDNLLFPLLVILIGAGITWLAGKLWQERTNS